MPRAARLLALLSGAPIQSWWTLGLCFTSVGYALLGHYLWKFGPSIPRGWFLAALGVGAAVTVGGAAFFSLKNGVLHELFLGGNTPGTCLMAFGLFGLGLTQKAYPQWGAGAAGRLARASFCIYLVHILFQRLFAHFGLSATAAPCALTIPGTALLMLGAGYLLWEVLHRVPVVKKYLV